LARDLLRDHADLREREQLRFRRIMVDEFQDTNRLQCDLIDLLAGGPGAPDVFTVGDEFQSIYGFRHADVQVFRDRRDQAGGGLALSRNYRSRPEVLAAVNHLFAEEFGDEFQPFVGASNDALVLIRRAAGRRPLFSGIEFDLPEELGERDAQLIRAFKQRYERLLAASHRRSLERLCEEIVAEHDYDLAVLTQWDGRRRYANLRKLARLARSFEDLRGADIEGFVRFVRAQDAVGARELEAVAQEEGSDAVRLLTI